MSQVIESAKGFASSMAGRVTAVAASMVGLILGGTAAYATPTTDASGVDSLFTSATSTLTGTLIPAVVGIVLIGALFWLGIRWFQKGKNAGNK